MGNGIVGAGGNMDTVYWRLAGIWTRYIGGWREYGHGIVGAGGNLSTVQWQFSWRCIFFGGIVEFSRNQSSLL